MIYNIYIEGKYVVKNLNTVPDTVGIPSFVVCLNPSVQERVRCAQMVRFCQVETEAKSFSIDTRKRSIWANTEVKKWC